MALFVPALIPFTFHWYDGEAPPLDGVAVKFTVADGQTGFAEGVIERLTGKFGFTVIVTALEVAGLPVAQVEFEVSKQVTTSPVVGE